MDPRAHEQPRDALRQNSSFSNFEICDITCKLAFGELGPDLAEKAVKLYTEDKSLRQAGGRPRQAAESPPEGAFEPNPTCPKAYES